MKIQLSAIIAGAVLAAGALAAPAQAAIIYPFSAVGSSSYGGATGYPDFDAIDQGPGADVSDWASQGDGSSSTLKLDLGAVYALDKAFVTDRVTSGGNNNGFVGGLFDFTTQFSLQVFTDSTFTTGIGTAQVFNRTPPSPHSSPADFLDVVSLAPGTTGEFVEYKVLATNGNNPGLSDIHFSTAAVPEPAAWTLMILGFGAAGAMLRRRARAALI